jgi:lysophospholipase L1-like esterase
MRLQTGSGPHSRRLKLLSSLALLASGIFFAMALAEGILRLVPGLLAVELQQIIQLDPDNFGVAHPYIGYLHTPNNTFTIAGRDFQAVNHTDAYGFRNAWPWPEKADIVTVGDSVVFGYGVEDDQAWPALMAKALPHNHLINLALIGAGPQQYLRVYETFGTKLYPKLLLVGFLARNDFWDDYMFDEWLKSGAGANYMVWRDFGRPKSTSLSLEQPISNLIKSLLWRGHLLASKSRLYKLLIYALKYFKGGGFSKPRIFRASDGTQLQLDLEDFKDQTGIGRPGNRAFDLVVQALQRLDSITQANGTQILVILQPSKEEVYLPLMGETSVDTDPERPLRAMLKKLGIPYLDLLPAFRERAAKGEVLFFETDGHPNSRGHALIAKLIFDNLKNNAKISNLDGLAESSLR